MTQNEKPPKCTILLLGLDNSGKTTFLNNLKNQPEALTMPTIGCAREVVEVNGAKFCILDQGGQECLRPFWHKYYDEADGIIFIIDAEDQEHSLEVGKMLKDLVNKTRSKSLMILLNKKSDGENHKIPNIVDLKSFLKNYNYLLFNCKVVQQKSVVDCFKRFIKAVEKDMKTNQQTTLLKV